MLLKLEFLGRGMGICVCVDLSLCICVWVCSRVDQVICVGSRE